MAPSSPTPGSRPKKRVLVVGAGAAGMSCAEQLSQHPEKYDVAIVEAQDYCGGQAFSIPIDEKKYGAPWMNQGVQGGSYIYHHTFRMFKKQGFEAEPVDLQVSFGKGDKFWTNVFPTKLVEKHQSEIKRFNWALKFMRWFEVFFALIPIKISLKMFFFSEEFMNYMIYPSLALFLGTGNATPDLPTIMMERLYTSPTYGMCKSALDILHLDLVNELMEILRCSGYPADPKSLSTNLPPMVVFPEESKFYTRWQHDMMSRGVNIRLNTEVVAIPERSKHGVRVQLRSRRPQPDHHNPVGADQDTPVHEEHYDEIVLCILADTAKRLLGKTAGLIEKAVLGSTRWSDDITVTHNDLDYINKWYTLDMPDESEIPTHLSGRDETARIQRAKEDFNPMYLIKQVPKDSRKLEMCFDCNAFQYQLNHKSHPKDHVFQVCLYPVAAQNDKSADSDFVAGEQTIFLNKKHKDTWSIDEIKEEKIIRKDWWHQLEHSWTHYAFVVPWMSFLNGTRHTRYAAAWTLVNAHELAVISGMAAAYALGASYPKELAEE
ncbi:hypothetical protein QFC24_003536 [Naganishia onofrii]|uniref:Uncharacterized protein n=1 Tax=Naganishia onofrii TaxID=1851511 RepID=A0ACC2XKG0_9TREE|nr:hypothetical protein QFC24_003536 [Naganishia onofrii]